MRATRQYHVAVSLLATQREADPFWVALSDEMRAGAASTVCPVRAAHQLREFVRRCDEEEEGMHGGLVSLSPGWPAVIDAARWGNWPFLEAMRAGGLSFARLLTDTRSGEAVNLLGVAVDGYCAAVELGADGEELREQWARTLAVLVRGGAGNTVVCAAPAPVAACLVPLVRLWCGVTLTGLVAGDDVGVPGSPSTSQAWAAAVA